MALVHMQSWAPALYNAYHERLATDKEFWARFDRRVKRYRTRYWNKRFEDDDAPDKKIVLKCRGCG